MLTRWLSWKNKWAAFSHDLIMIPIAWLGTFWLRANLSTIPQDILLTALNTLPFIMLCQIIGFWVFGLYRGVWRFASMRDLERIIKAVFVGSIASLIGLFLFSRLNNIPRSVFPIYSLLLLFGLGGSRFIYRALKDKTNIINSKPRAVIIGAGKAGAMLAREMLNNKTSPFNPVIFLDDDKTKVGREIYGIRVIDRTHNIQKITKKFNIEQILIALPSANSEKMRKILKLAHKTKINVRTLPSINDLASGEVTINSLREVQIEDLLGRESIKLDKAIIESDLKNQNILVTGGGGSIGSELCRQIIKYQVNKLIVLDNSEYNLFVLQQELEKYNNIKYILADIGDIDYITHIIKINNIKNIFHAAAFKHVPLLEPQVIAAVKNNILGTYNLAKLATNLKIHKFVLVSTDKAVNPANIMGASKRAAELICQAFNQSNITKFITVRFGNVLGSRGSVIETFREQLKQGGPLTVTHPDITRYFMTIPEASQLILQAFAQGDGGEIFVLDMGKPIKISFLAEQMIKLASSNKKDIQIKYTGLRPGEKLYEELFFNQEELLATRHKKIMKAKVVVINSENIHLIIEKFKIAYVNNQADLMLSLLKQLVPQMKSGVFVKEQCTVHE